MATQFTIAGRIVQGDPYRMEQRKDDNDQPRVKADGTPMMSSFIALAIPKGDPNWPAHRALFDAEAQKAWPNGEWQHPSFANKIEDGDSTIPNKKGKRNADREGFPGNWIVKLGSGYAASVKYWDDVKGWTDSIPNSGGPQVKCGDYVSVIGTIDTNGPSKSPGMYMNLNVIALEREGVAIQQTSIDLNAALGTRGPGGAAVPPTPPVSAASPPPPAHTPPSPPIASPSNPPPPPHTGFMAPPPAPPAGPVMLPAANGVTYEAYIAAGWTHEQMVAAGYIA